MNIKIPNLEKLNESTNNKSDLKESDLLVYLDENFPDNPKSWKEATGEIVEMANWIYETLDYPNQNNPQIQELKDTKKSKSPKEWNLKHKKRIINGFKLLDSYNKQQFFETFGEWINNPKKLNESQQIIIEDEEIIEDVVNIKSNQFNFDCGLYMGTIKSGLDTKFGLAYHALNTLNLEEFIDSVNNFLSTTNNQLTENDIEKLTAHYIKYNK